MTLPPLLLRTALSENDVKALSDWAAEAADAITQLRAERDTLLEQRRHLLDTNLVARACVQIQKELNAITTERDALAKLLADAP